MSSAQKVIKYFAIAFAISLILGIFWGIYQAGVLVGGAIKSGSSNDGLKIDNYPSTSKILSIDIGAANLKIVEGTTLNVESNNKYIEYKRDNNKLAVTEKSHNILNKKDNGDVKVTIPKDMTFDKVYISSGAGTINIENITAEDLELDLGAGKIEINRMTTNKNTEIEGGAGEVQIRNSKLSNLDLDVGVGKFTLDATLAGKNEIDAGVGELNINLLDSKNNYSIYTETGIGSINIDGKRAKDETTTGTGNNRINIDGGIGSINITFNN